MINSNSNSLKIIEEGNESCGHSHKPSPDTAAEPKSWNEIMKELAIKR